MKNRRIAVRGIVCDPEGKIFCVRHKKYDGNKFTAKDFWCLPGGGLDIGEDILAGVKREMVEETGIEPEVGSLLYIQQFSYLDTEHLEFFFHIKNTKDYLQIDLESSTHGFKEIAECGFVDIKEVTFLPEFLSGCDIQEHINKQSSPQIFNRL